MTAELQRENARLRDTVNRLQDLLDARLECVPNRIDIPPYGAMDAVFPSQIFSPFHFPCDPVQASMANFIGNRVRDISTRLNQTAINRPHHLHFQPQKGRGIVVSCAGRSFALINLMDQTTGQIRVEPHGWLLEEMESIK